MKVRELKKLIEEAYIQVLREIDEPTPEDPIGDEKASEETVLEDATDTMLEKFPTLKSTLIKLMTRDYNEFVDTIDWISPKPTAFNFQAQVLGKNYFLGTVSEFQQALDKLAQLYQEAPLTGAGEADAEGGAADDFSAGSGGEFPGEEGGAPAPGAEGGEEAGGEEGGADLGGEEIDFEAGEEPEA